MGDVLHAVTIRRSVVETFDLWTRFETMPRGRRCLGDVNRCHRGDRDDLHALESISDVSQRSDVLERCADARKALTHVGCSSGTVWFVPEQGDPRDGQDAPAAVSCLVVMQSPLALHVDDDLSRFKAFVDREELDDALDELMAAVVRDQVG